MSPGMGNAPLVKSGMMLSLVAYFHALAELQVNLSRQETQLLLVFNPVDYSRVTGRMEPGCWSAAGGAGLPDVAAKLHAWSLKPPITQAAHLLNT